MRMYFTDTPTLNSMEAIMQQTPKNSHQGGRRRRPYQYAKEDCDCRFCLYYKGKATCTVDTCPVIDIRLECGAATLADAVKESFKARNSPALKKRISRIFDREDNTPMLFRDNQHRLIYKEQHQLLRKPSKKAEAVLYLLTADKTLWQNTRHHITKNGKVDIKNVHLGGISPDGYALWKAAKELQTGETQISLSELTDREAVSDYAFQYIVLAVTIARFGTAALKKTETNHHV